MAPWYARMEERLGVAPWAVEPNANNAVLRDGCEKLGLHWKTVPRNVRGCWNIGYCGLGCPTNARSEEHTSELQSLMRISYAVFCLKKKKKQEKQTDHIHQVNHNRNKRTDHQQL